MSVIAMPARARAISAQVSAARVPPAALERRVSGEPSLRLTGRGRWVVSAVMMGLAIAGSLALGGVGRAAQPSDRPAFRILQVAPGETLWSIAAENLPDMDRQAAVARIIEINALPTAGVVAGQELAVPLRP